MAPRFRRVERVAGRKAPDFRLSLKALIYRGFAFSASFQQLSSRSSSKTDSRSANSNVQTRPYTRSVRQSPSRSITARPDTPASMLQGTPLGSRRWSGPNKGCVSISMLLPINSPPTSSSVVMLATDMSGMAVNMKSLSSVSRAHQPNCPNPNAMVVPSASLGPSMETTSGFDASKPSKSCARRSKTSEKLTNRPRSSNDTDTRHRPKLGPLKSIILQWRLEPKVLSHFCGPLYFIATSGSNSNAIRRDEV